MDIIEREITAEQYAGYKAMTPGQLNHAVEETLSEDIVCGYGYYGSSIGLKDGKYYLFIRTGSTCD